MQHNIFNSFFIINKKYFEQLKLSSIPHEWQIILINEGSFTQNLNYISGNKIKITMQQKYNYNFYNNEINNIRYVWLENSIYTKLTFARSLWIFKYKDNLYHQLKINKPIGSLLINNEKDIYKNVYEIYYGYCQFIEKYFEINQPIWGRKSILHSNDKAYANIQEFFSPHIIKFCHLYY